MPAKIVKLGDCAFEILIGEADTFRGIGKVWIGETLVRSGRLPWSVCAQSFGGLELSTLKLLGIEASSAMLCLRTRALFRTLPVKLMRDHSFDPIHDLSDWDNTERCDGEGDLTLVLRPATDAFDGVSFAGFSYSWEYTGPQVPLFYLYDRTSWEIGGDITGATVISQSACSAPVHTFTANSAWSTEGMLFFAAGAENQNPVMTHNLPRWASHGSFDFQAKGNLTLLGVFERVELIRSVVCREAGKPELKHFDKHLFDQTGQFATSPKKILLNCAARTTVARQNLWSRVFEDTNRRALAEHGIREVPLVPFMFQNFWEKFTIDSYYRDLIPAAKAVGARRLFLDNLKKSSMTERAPMPGEWNWNMCCGHEYEISDRLGGNAALKRLVEECRAHGIQPMSWTNNDQSLASPLNSFPSKAGGWDGNEVRFVFLEDTRQKYGGAYAGCLCALDLQDAETRRYFVDSHVKIKEATGHDCFFFDSFYNLAFMPINYKGVTPRTMWRGVLAMVREMQQHGISMAMESFGPWAQVVHGHTSDYNLDTIFTCYRVGVGTDYTTMPSNLPVKDVTPESAELLYWSLAHMACASVPLFIKEKRVDAVWGAPHKQALDDYHTALPHLHRRILQEDNQSVIWHDAAGRTATIFNMKPRTVTLPGTVTDLTTGQTLKGKQTLAPLHTYLVQDAGQLPVALT